MHKCQNGTISAKVGSAPLHHHHLHENIFALRNCMQSASLLEVNRAADVIGKCSRKLNPSYGSYTSDKNL